jgi:two-component system cell cycle response regulator DivK
VSPTARVLIVDRSPESRDVLGALLARRGADVLEAREASRGAELADAEHPDLIVVDVEERQNVCEDSAARLVAAAARNDAPIVVLGSIERSASHWATSEFVAKPYQYPELIRRIEMLLGSRR